MFSLDFTVENGTLWTLSLHDNIILHVITGVYHPRHLNT